MTDEEIIQYLRDRNFQVSASDGIMDILNTSYQIIDTHYNPISIVMTIIIPKNTFHSYGCLVMVNKERKIII